MSGHLSEETLAGVASDLLEQDALDAAVAHLEACAACRDALVPHVEAEQVLVAFAEGRPADAAPKPANRPWWPIGGGLLLAIAAAALLVFAWPGASDPLPSYGVEVRPLVAEVRGGERDVVWRAGDALEVVLRPDVAHEVAVAARVCVRRGPELTRWPLQAEERAPSGALRLELAPWAPDGPPPSSLEVAVGPVAAADPGCAALPAGWMALPAVGVR